MFAEPSSPPIGISDGGGWGEGAGHSDADDPYYEDEKDSDDDALLGRALSPSANRSTVAVDTAKTASDDDVGDLQKEAARPLRLVLLSLAKVSTTPSSVQRYSSRLLPTMHVLPTLHLLPTMHLLTWVYAPSCLFHE